MTPDEIKRRLGSLKTSIATSQKNRDLEGLLLLRGDAQTIAASTSGRTNRSARKITDRADAAIEALRRDGVETETERIAREEQAAREERQRAREESARLIRRLACLVQLMLYDGSEDGNGFLALQSFEITGESSFPAPAESLKVIEPWWWITGAYEQSRLIFAGRGGATLRRNARELEQTLKSTAVELIMAGAEVRDLSTDVVPLLAYSLFIGRVQPASGATAGETAETVDELLLGMAEDVASLPRDVRPALVGLLRLAILLGEAQAFADDAGLRTLEPRDAAFTLADRRYTAPPGTTTPTAAADSPD